MSIAVRSIALLVAFGTSPAIAQSVTLANGNFFVGYSDIEYDSGYGLGITRYYNSKTSFHGPFGWAWGLDYAVQLSVAGDGSVGIREYGGGAENQFHPPEPSPEELEEAVARILAVDGEELTALERADLEQLLRNDAQFRNNAWRRLVRQGDVSPRQLPVGTRLESRKYGHQHVARTDDGYLREFGDGRSELFDTDGRLVRKEDRNGNFVVLAYDARGRLERIEDNLGQVIRLVVDDRGLVREALGGFGERATYRYNDREQLVHMRDAQGNTYMYAYDARHNLTSIRYDDGTTREIDYYDRGLFENVASVQGRDGRLTTYAYTYDGDDVKVEKVEYAAPALAETLALPEPVPAGRDVLTREEPFAGRLDGTTRLPDERPFEAWRLTAVAGDTFTVHMRSEELDSWLAVTTPGGPDVVLLASDDDGGGGRDARLVFTAPEDGDYLILACGYDASGVGAYELLVEASGQSDSTSSETARRRTLSRSSYEYSRRRKANGQLWTERLVEVVNGRRTATTYDELCGMPLLIERGLDSVRFEYDASCRVTFKETPEEITRLTYHSTWGKVTRVARLDKTEGPEIWSEFEYDDRGNVVTARNSAGAAATLHYDDLGRIERMSTAEEELLFAYDENSKPVRIEVLGVGTIHVTYRPGSGEVDAVQSDEGRGVAMAVTSSFQRLLDILRPAGVTLGF